MTKKVKKEKKTLSLSEFQSQGKPIRQPRNALPQGPGEAPDRPSYGGRRGGRRGGYGDQERSRADESNQWRRNGPPQRRSNNSGGGFSGGGFKRDNDRGDRSFGGDRRDNRRDRDRGDRDRGDRDGGRSDELFSRASFGQKKQTGGFGGGRSNNNYRNDRSDRSDRNDGGNRMRNDFGGRNRDRDSNDDMERGDRSKWGRQVQIKPTMGGGRNGPSSRSYQRKRGEFDGSGKGFGASIVADCFLPLEPEETEDRRVHYTNKRMTAWNQPVREKSEEQIQKEKEREEERRRKEEEDRKNREEKEKKRAAEKKKKEDEQKRLETERKRKEEEKKKLEEMHRAVTEIMESSGDVMQLTAEQCEIVLPGLETEGEHSERLGTALGMSVHNDVLGMNDAISLLPQASHDLILANMFCSIIKRTGEAKFLRQIDENQLNFEEIVRDPDEFESLCKNYDLMCILGGDEDNAQLEEAFASHINLKELNELLGKDPISPTLRQRIFTYVCDEFFTNRDVKNPSAYFDDVELFYTVTSEEKHVLDLVDVLIDSWFSNGKEADVLVTLFDHLITSEIVPSFCVLQWNMASEGNMDAKMKALVSHCDFRFKVDDEVYEGTNFATWLSQVDAIYPEPEEEDDGMWEEHGV